MGKCSEQCCGPKIVRNPSSSPWGTRWSCPRRSIFCCTVIMATVSRSPRDSQISMLGLCAWRIVEVCQDLAPLADRNSKALHRCLRTAVPSSASSRTGRWLRCGVCPVRGARAEGIATLPGGMQRRGQRRRSRPQRHGGAARHIFSGGVLAGSEGWARVKSGVVLPLLSSYCKLSHRLVPPRSEPGTVRIPRGPQRSYSHQVKNSLARHGLDCCRRSVSTMAFTAEQSTDLLGKSSRV